MPSAEHDEVVALLRATAAALGEPPDIPASRANLDATGAMFAVPDDVIVTADELAGIPCECHVPAGVADGAGSPVMLYLHGGSYTAGSLASHRALVARLARACRCRAVAAEYRLAPEHPFPAGLDDATAVLGALEEGGTPPARVVVAGDSAGGGLATALLLRRRDAGRPPVAGAVLISPWLDLTMTSRASVELADVDPMLDRDRLAESAAAYAGPDVRRPLVSPVFADPSGLPPLLVLAGTADLLVDDARTFTDRARAAGVAVDLELGEGLVHVWPFIDGVPEAAAALERIADWTEERWAR